MLLMTTHYPQLTKLAIHSHNFWNGSLGVQFQNHIPRFDYRLKAGPSYHRIALELLSVADKRDNDYVKHIYQGIISKAKQFLAHQVVNLTPTT